MHLTSEMQRVTHETKNIKSMIANFKSEMGQMDMKRSKSGNALRTMGDSRHRFKFSKKQTGTSKGWGLEKSNGRNEDVQGKEQFRFETFNLLG